MVRNYYIFFNSLLPQIHPNQDRSKCFVSCSLKHVSSFRKVNRLEFLLQMLKMALSYRHFARCCRLHLHLSFGSLPDLRI